MLVGQKDLPVLKFLHGQTAVGQSMVVYAHEGTKSFSLVLAVQFWDFFATSSTTGLTQTYSV